MSDRITYIHDEPTRFTTFALGRPGEREFFIHVESAQGATTIACEKSQVIALSERFSELITELRRARLVDTQLLLRPPVKDSGDISFPVVEDFTAGVMGIAWEESTSRVQVEIQGFGDGTIIDLINDSQSITLEDPPEIMRTYLTIAQLRGFINTASELSNSGRKPCMFCGLPIDPQGHLCPRANGYRR